MCMFRDHCNMLMCLADENWRNEMRQILYRSNQDAVRIRTNKKEEINEQSQKTGEIRE